MSESITVSFFSTVLGDDVKVTVPADSLAYAVGYGVRKSANDSVAGMAKAGKTTTEIRTVYQDRLDAIETGQPPTTGGGGQRADSRLRHCRRLLKDGRSRAVVAYKAADVDALDNVASCAEFADARLGDGFGERLVNRAQELVSIEESGI